MELICKLTDEDIGEEIINMENPKLRLGARGIVIREDGKILLMLLEIGVKIVMC